MPTTRQQYQPPPWVAEHMDAATYTRYVKRMARGAFLRDVKRGGTYTIEEAAAAIHAAVHANEGRDHWTGELMRWDLLGKYDSSESATRGGAYKKELAMKPTIDHRDNQPTADFVICAWRTNDAKHDMSIEAEGVLPPGAGAQPMNKPKGPSAAQKRETHRQIREDWRKEGKRNTKPQENLEEKRKKEELKKRLEREQKEDGWPRRYGFHHFDRTTEIHALLRLKPRNIGSIDELDYMLHRIDRIQDHDYDTTKSQKARLTLLEIDCITRKSELRAKQEDEQKAQQRAQKAVQQYATTEQDAQLALALHAATDAVTHGTGYLYLRRWVMPDGAVWFKVGITNEPDRRESEQNVLPVPMETIACTDVGSIERARALEAAIHRVLDEQRITGASNRELFHLTDAQVATVKAVIERLS